MQVDVGPRIAWGTPLPIRAAARDLRTGPGGPGDVAVADAASLDAAFDEQRALVELGTQPVAPWAAALVGVRAGGGFRRSLDALTPPEEAGSLLRQVLDDLPAAVLISGYAFMRMAHRAGTHPSRVAPPAVLDRMVDLCSGWRAGGTMVASIAAGRGVPVQDCPPAPDLTGGDPWSWHEMPTLGADWMRRRRCIDLGVGPDGSFTVWAMFRDSVGEGGGREAVLHEYALRASGTGDALTAVSAEPRVLPFGECPAAADAVGAIAGTALGDLPDAVPASLVGVRSCTHLNDLLRSLGGVGALLDRARAAS